MDMTPLAAWGAARKPGGAMRRHAMLFLLPRASSHSTITNAMLALDMRDMGQMPKPCACAAAISSTAPRRNGRGAVGGRQAALGLLRDQMRSCVPFSPSIRRA